MTRRFLAIFTIALLLPALIVGADEPPAGGDGPLRLKRKKRSGDAKVDKPKAGPDTGKEPPAKPKAKDEEPLIPEEGGADGPPQEDEKDILARIDRNIRAVEEKLGNRELGEPTRQQQQDILRDLDALLKKSENPSQSGGGGGGPPPPPQDNSGEDGKQGQQGKAGKGGAGMPKSGGMGQGGQRQQRRQRQARRRTSGRNSTARNQPSRGGQSSNPKPGGGKGGTQPGGGGDGPITSPRDVETKKRNEVWGHLPESLRAEMNAYSNPQPFLPRYDRLIREYYKTIAEQGRKKGD